MLIVVVMVVLAVAAVAVAAFVAITSNTGNTISTATVGALTDDDGGAPMFVLTGLQQGDIRYQCLKVTKDTAGGGLGLTKLYGTATGTLPPNLTLTVDTVASGGFGSGCDGSNTQVAPVYSGLLSAFVRPIRPTRTVSMPKQPRPLRCTGSSCRLVPGPEPGRPPQPRSRSKRPGFDHGWRPSRIDHEENPQRWPGPVRTRPTRSGR